jgi:hypothetical protein
MLTAAIMTDDADPKRRTTFNIEASLLDGLDELRKDEPGLPSRAGMVRLLIRRALAEKAAKAKQPKN